MHLVPKIKDHMTYHSQYDIQNKESTQSVPFPCLVSMFIMLLKILHLKSE